jgi:hypothetical protein
LLLQRKSASDAATTSLAHVQQTKRQGSEKALPHLSDLVRLGLSGGVATSPRDDQIV